MDIIRKAVIVSAPSGAGKTTIVRHLLKSALNLEFSVSACSRPKREGEIHGKDYYFLSPDEFREKITAGDFLEWQEVYPGSFYGTLNSELERIWQGNRHVIFDVDVFGGINLKRILAEKAFSLFIVPPSIDILEARIRNRALDSEDSIKKRLAKAQLELEQQANFDKIIINDSLQTAVEQAEQAVQSFLTKTG